MISFSFSKMYAPYFFRMHQDWKEIGKQIKQLGFARDAQGNQDFVWKNIL